MAFLAFFSRALVAASQAQPSQAQFSQLHISQLPALH